MARDREVEPHEIHPLVSFALPPAPPACSGAMSFMPAPVACHTLSSRPSSRALPEAISRRAAGPPPRPGWCRRPVTSATSPPVTTARLCLDRIFCRPIDFGVLVDASIIRSAHDLLCFASISLRSIAMEASSLGGSGPVRAVWLTGSTLYACVHRYFLQEPCISQPLERLKSDRIERDKRGLASRPPFPAALMWCKHGRQKPANLRSVVTDP